MYLEEVLPKCLVFTKWVNHGSFKTRDYRVLYMKLWKWGRTRGFNW